MARELLRASQFRSIEQSLQNDNLILSDELKNELSSLYEDISNSFKQGSIVTGKVLKVDSDGVLVNIDYKSDGVVPGYEFTHHELKALKAGSPIEVMIDEIENLSGTVMLSYEKAKALKAWGSIMKLYDENQPVDGVVTHKVKGGLSVDIGIPAFLPGSQVDTQRVADFDQFVGQTITAFIIKINQKRGNVIISRRKYLNEERAESRKKVLDTLDVGSVVRGTVKNITKYGVFIDIGGVDGLLHITDMTWGRIAHPSELVKIGETVTVKILSFDKDTEKISLGMKQLAENPWETIDPKIEVGSKIKGKISSITDYGLFVEVQPGVEGLIHISEVSWTDRISDLHKYFRVNDMVEALVVSLDKENRRMSLSIKQLGKNPWDTISTEYKVGQKISGKISNVTEFGIFIQLAPGIDGLVHISDFSWTEHIEHPADRYKKGDEVEAVITAINTENKKISLGIKQLKPNPWEEIEKKYPVGSSVEGEVSKITNFGAFVKLPSGVEGLVHVSELGSDTQKIEDILKIGETKTFKVIKVSPEEHKLGLSLRSEAEVAASSAKEKARKEKAPAAPRKEPAVESASSKQKSQLQIELEKHAARQSDDTSGQTPVDEE